MAKWIEYIGSDEQIVALLTSSDEFIVDSKWSIFKDPTKLSILPLESNIEWLRKLLNSCDVKRFMFCKPHPYAGIIKTWADTGCMIHVREPIDYAMTGYMYKDYATDQPNWNIPNAKFRLTPFED